MNIRIRTHYYQQFEADYSRDVPAEGYPGWYASVEYFPRANRILELIYSGFALNWCLLLSPGGMAEMGRQGLMCSAFREATTAVENKETAREELCKQIALWRVDGDAGEKMMNAAAEIISKELT